MIDSITEARTRPAGDILSRLVRITLGGTQYELPVRSIKANREWKAQLDGFTAAKVDALSNADSLEKLTSVLQEDDIDSLIDLLVSYDTSGQITRDLIESIEPDATLEVVAACQEVWLAATPLVARTLALMNAESAFSTPTSSPSPSGAKGRRKSRTN